jgi:4'-phosphopantetheinyl transferase
VNHSIENPIEIFIFSLQCDDDKRHSFYQTLSEDEKQRAAAFRFEKHRHRFITGRATIREILANKGDCQAREISFALSSYGKPSALAPDSVSCLQFSASSTGTMGAIAISNGDPIGFDIEEIKPGGRRDYDLIVKNQFTGEEFEWYAKHDQRDRIPAFLRLWTCKEAYLKALGIGLSGELDSFSIDLRGEEPSISYTDLESSESSKFSLYGLKIADGFFACLALPHKSDQIKLSHW